MRSRTEAISPWGVSFFRVAICSFSLVAITVMSGFAGQEDRAEGMPEPAPVLVNSPRPPEKPPSKAESRGRAEILHDLIEHTLLDVHKHYYREDEGLLLPATTLRGTFEKFGERRNIRIRWLAVDAEPMNIDHRPQDDFEHAAVEALKTGQPVYDEALDGQYRYAGTIRLTAECLKCHVPNRTSTKDRLAGIVISMPFVEEP